MDTLRLIEEVHKRPILWNCLLKNRPPKIVNCYWDAVASSLGDNVTTRACRNTWQKLRTGYRRMYLKYIKQNRKFDPKKSSDFNSVYYEHMHFLNKIFLHRDGMLVDNETSLPASEISQDNVTADESDEEEEPLNSLKHDSRSKKCRKQYSPGFNCEIEDELYSTDDEEEEIRKSTKRPRLISHNSEEYNSYKKKGFENQHIQQNNNAKEPVNVLIAEKDYSNLHSKSLLQDLNDSDHYFLLSFSDHLKSLSQLQNLHFRTKMSELILSILTTSLSNEKTQEYNTQAESLVNVGDLDSNFLISFWPYMKLMTQLQNLQFRAKISALMLNILPTHGK